MNNRDKWYGPHNNPFKAWIKCAKGENRDTQEVTQFIFWDWAETTDLSDKADERDFIDNLLQDIAGYTNIVVQKKEDGWYACYDGEDE